MKKNVTKIVLDIFKKVERKGERVIKQTGGEMTRQIEKMGKLGGTLYICY